MYSATLDEEEIEFDDTDNEEEGEHSKNGRSRKENFLKSMEEKIDPLNKEHKDRFAVIKNQIIEKVKTTQNSRRRSRSGSSVSRSQSQKRDLSSDSKLQDPGSVRPKTSGIPKVK